MVTDCPSELSPPLKLRTTLRDTPLGALVLVPLVNVFFLLLIFFFLGSSVINPPGFKVELPKTDEDIRGDADKVVIWVTRDSQIYFNDQRVETMDLLEDSLQKLVQGYARAPVIIVRADRELPYQKLVDVMTISRRHGARVFLVTDSSRRPAAGGEVTP